MKEALETVDKENTEFWQACIKATKEKRKAALLVAKAELEAAVTGAETTKQKNADAGIVRLQQMSTRFTHTPEEIHAEQQKVFADNPLLELQHMKFAEQLNTNFEQFLEK